MKIVITIIGIICFFVGVYGTAEFVSSIKSDFSYGGQMHYWIDEDSHPFLGLIFGVLGYSIAGICLFF